LTWSRGIGRSSLIVSVGIPPVGRLVAQVRVRERMGLKISNSKFKKPKPLIQKA
jgi:hypothetical protein